MDDQTVTPIRAGTTVAPEIKQPLCFVTLPGSVDVAHLGAREQFYRPNPRGKTQLTAKVDVFDYSGDAGGLIALGIALVQMLERRRPGSARFDEEGYRCSVVRSWREGGDGQPYQHYRVTLCRPLNRIGELSGAHDTILAMQSYQRFREATIVASLAERALRSAPRQRPQLRLVVDNTR
jgi:hypothetical protein